MCKRLGISHAAYYKWLHRTIPEQESENTKLAELIKEYDERFGHILGYRRMTSWINHFNHTSYSKNRICRYCLFPSHSISLPVKQTRSRLIYLDLLSCTLSKFQPNKKGSNDQKSPEPIRNSWNGLSTLVHFRSNFLSRKLGFFENAIRIKTESGMQTTNCCSNLACFNNNRNTDRTC